MLQAYFYTFCLSSYCDHPELSKMDLQLKVVVGWGRKHVVVFVSRTRG